MGKKESLRSKGVSKNKGGGDSMKRLLVIGLMLLVSGTAFGAQEDTVILTVNPVFSLSVNISSTTNSFGTGSGYANDVVLGTSRTICVGEIENDGNVSSKWQKRASGDTDPSAGDEWYLLSSSSVVTGQNTFQLLAITTGTETSPNFTGSGDDQMIAGDLGKIMVSSITWTDLTEGSTASPVHPKTEKRRLWASILMPTNITTDGTQSITLSVRAMVQ